MTGNTRPTSVGREIFLRFLKKPPLVVDTKVLTADTISIGAVSFRQKTAFLPSERETAPQNIGPNGYAKGDDESMRKIVLDMQSGIFARTIQRMLLQELDDCQVIISEHPDKTVQRCKTFKPYALLMEATGYTPWMLEERLAIRDKVKQNDPDCKIVILVDDQADSELAQKVRDAKREGKIDAFLFGSVTEQYMAAVLDTL